MSELFISKISLDNGETWCEPIDLDKEFNTSIDITKVRGGRAKLSIFEDASNIDYSKYIKVDELTVKAYKERNGEL